MIKTTGVLLSLILTLAAGLTAQSPKQTLLALSKRDHTLSIVDPATLKVVGKAPVGEDPHSRDAVQSRLNDLCAGYNDAIREVCSREGTDYIGFYEAFRERLDRSTAAKPFTRFSFPSFYRDYLVREMVLRLSFDEISETNGWEFHIDGVHLNTRGGRILTEAVQRFLDSP